MVRRSSYQENSYSIAIRAGICLRIWFLFTPVFLSEDVFRFLWDGLLVQEGISPYSILPKELGLFETEAWKKELLTQMNSPGYYSVYPPLLQILFLLPSWVLRSSGSVFLGIFSWKIIVLLSELGIYFIVRLRGREEDKASFLQYWLHPLVLWEGVANGHSEPILFLFLLLGLVYWQRGKSVFAFLFYLGSILIKILPLILAPYLFFSWIRTRSRKEILILFTIGSIALIGFGYYFFFYFLENELLRKQWTKGLGVYFNLFEFHGAVYYLAKIPMKYTWYPYSAAPVLGCISFLWICFYSFLVSKKEYRNKFAILPHVWVSICGIYYILSSTIHPWYILPMIGASLFSKDLWPLVAGMAWILSYSTYSTPRFQDQVWAMVLENLIIFVALGYQLFYSKIRKSKEVP
ncbi:hypothetical protein EHO59_17235 [Leptospira semungkisensis]|uniref:DUF2029 domain-containing protein n=1 Tax=Leptospira semungkisensis TaxID=2484985 RepID=A0A4R9FLX5_9LEPT|nr:hypothetical protein [Leptospira semungkisensis]TGJ99587.1 hypothetical protein EHO59_17235 [Leptospira semungkisensis]